MAEKKSFYITTPIYYVNDVPHIGHAYTTIGADVMARYKRMTGHDVFFLTGTDEHGQKIYESAQSKGMTAQELTDAMAENFKRLLPVLNISNDDFIRTTEKRHETAVQSIFKILMDQGDIYKGTYKGLYCVPCETYVPESSVGEANTCPDCGRPLVEMEEESYFFRTSEYADQLLAFYEDNLKAIMPKSRYNEIVSFIKSGLRDQSVSRTTISWGIPVPGDEKHVIYVWFDALINYLTACGYGVDQKKMEEYWPSVHHLMAKDIIRFHCVIWPIMLIALGLNPPVRVFSHGWWTMEGEKMSKSKGNVVDPFQMVELYGVDAFRYFLLRQVPFGTDGDFSEAAMVQRINSDLANDLGNLLSRTVSMIVKYRGGIVPIPEGLSQVDLNLSEIARESVNRYGEAMDDYGFDEALKAVWSLVGRANKYIDETMPWKLGADGDVHRLDAVLWGLVESLKVVSMMVSPFMPETAEIIWSQLGFCGEPATLQWSHYKWGEPTTKNLTVRKGPALFPRIDMEAWQEEKKKRDQAKKGLAVDPGQHEDEISIDDVTRVELRVAKILSVEDVPKARKLYKLEIDLGYERRTIVSGLKEQFTPEQLLDRKIIVVVNLKPAKLCGVQSNGMLLAASLPGYDGLSLLGPIEDIPLGSRVH
ncbi:MAG: methionine--tRNA ligase [Dethiosulfovibrio peptidovorans]|nr:MAG: methionine--tRNA ligase [Dethiosulfovibrio peptidovorans]